MFRMLLSMSKSCVWLAIRFHFQLSGMCMTLRLWPLEILAKCHRAHKIIEFQLQCRSEHDFWDLLADSQRQQLKFGVLCMRFSVDRVSRAFYIRLKIIQLTHSQSGMKKFMSVCVWSDLQMVERSTELHWWAVNSEIGHFCGIFVCCDLFRLALSRWFVCKIVDFKCCLCGKSHHRCVIAFSIRRKEKKFSKWKHHHLINWCAKITEIILIFRLLKTLQINWKNEYIGLKLCSAKILSRRICKWTALKTSFWLYGVCATVA